MCGIFAFMSKEEVNSEHLLRAIKSLQHRGHDAWGISYLFEGRMESFKQTGTIEPQMLRPFSTRLAVAHNRYQTSGAGSHNEIQPFSSPQLTMCHNGQITNFTTEQFTSDSLQLFAYLQKNALSEEIFTHFAGSYSVVGSHHRGLYAFRDAHGFRPLFMGQKAKHWVAFSSEEGPLRRLGADSIEEIAPGSIVQVEQDTLTISQQTLLKPPAPKSCFFENIYFSSVESTFQGMSILQMREKVGLALAEQLAKSFKARQIEIDYVIPIPDTSIPAAIVIAEALNLPYRQYILKNANSLRTFITRFEREKSIENKYFFIKEKFKSKHILLIDDSIVRGGTLKSINQFLRTIGVASLHVASTCPPILHPCPYGIDFPSSEELVAYSAANEEELQKRLYADSLHYLELTALKEVMGHNHCYACIDGNYPVAVAKEFFLARKREHAKQPGDQYASIRQ